MLAVTPSVRLYETQPWFPAEDRQRSPSNIAFTNRAITWSFILAVYLITRLLNHWESLFHMNATISDRAILGHYNIQAVMWWNCALWRKSEICQKKTNSTQTRCGVISDVGVHNANKVFSDLSKFQLDLEMPWIFIHFNSTSKGYIFSDDADRAYQI